MCSSPNSGTRANEDAHIRHLLTSGVYKPPKDYVEADPAEDLLDERKPLKSINQVIATATVSDTSTSARSTGALVGTDR